jgi:preprotein translocase subunit SecA
MNQQRETIYAERNKVLEGQDVHAEVLEMFPEVVERIVFGCLDDDKPYFEWDLKEINTALEDRLFEKGSNIVDEKFVEDCEVKDVYDKVLKLVDSSGTTSSLSCRKEGYIAIWLRGKLHSHLNSFLNASLWFSEIFIGTSNTDRPVVHLT